MGTFVRNGVPYGGSTDIDAVHWEDQSILGAKNLLPNNAVAQTVTGLTFVINSDGSITANGTSTYAWAERITGMTLKKGQYILSDGGASISNTIRLQVVNQAETAVIAHTNASHEMEFELSEDTFVYVRIFWNTDITVSNLTFYPMIRLASDTDNTYVPYAMTNRELTNNKVNKTQISNPNLLDNPWFTVNQRGQSSYTSGPKYTVDRWQSGNNKMASVNVEDNGITITATTFASGESTEFRHRIENAVSSKLDGKTLTLSAIVNGQIYSVTGVYHYDVNETPLSIEVTSGVLLQLRNIPAQNSRCIARFLFNYYGSEKSISVRAIKLELGSISTLDLDTAPNYATELLKCQRYFYRVGKDNFNTSSFVGIALGNGNATSGFPSFPVKMRTKPVASNYSAHRFDNKTEMTITNFFVDEYGIQGCVLTGSTVGYGYSLAFDVSADL